MGGVTLPTGFNTIRFGNEPTTNSCWAYVVRTRLGNFAYVNARAIGATTTTIAQRVVAIARGMIPAAVRSTTLEDVFGVAYNSNCHCSFADSARVGRGLCSSGDIDALLPRIAAAGEHLTHLLPSEVMRVATESSLAVHAWAAVGFASRLRGATQATLATFMLWATTAEPRVVRAYLSVLADSSIRDVWAYVKYAKGVSTRAKQLEHSHAIPLVSLFETDVLVNRGLGEVDWVTERRNRTELLVVDVAPDDVFREAMRIFAGGRAKGYRYGTKKWQDWWQTRWVHVPNGSAHALSAQLSAQRDALRKLDGFGKKVLLSSVPNISFDELITRRPRIEAWASEKYEWGKKRAIYGTDTEGYMLFDFAFPNCEYALPRYIIAGEDAREDRVQRLMSVLTDGLMPFCFDFEDFNSQHSTSSMRAVLRAYRTTFADSMSQEQLDAALWCEQSVEEMYIHPNTAYKTEGYRANGTLLSGWRLTTLVNGVLNRVYLKLSGALECAIASVHSGDDVYATVTNVWEAEVFRRRAVAAGIRAQASKAATGSIAEFLRVDHRGPGVGAQYIARACATAVHGRMESRTAQDLLSALSATVTRAGELRDRGAPAAVCASVVGIQVRHLSDVFNADLAVSQHIMTAHPLEGGMDDSAPLTGARLVTDDVVRVSADGRTLRADERDLGVMAACVPGVTDFTNWLVKRLRRPELFARIFKKAIESTAKGLVRVRRKVHLETYYATNEHHLDRDSYRMWRSGIELGLASVLKGLDPMLAVAAAAVLRPDLRQKINSSADPYRALRVLV